MLPPRANNRLLPATVEHPSLLGVGSDEWTALQLDRDGSWKVVGEEGAVLTDDAREAHHLGVQRGPGHERSPHAPAPAGSTFDPAIGFARLPDELLTPVPGG